MRYIANRNFLLLIISLVSSLMQAATPFALIKQFIPDNPVILEAGARFGEDTIKMSEQWPQGIIYSFEPLPSSAEQLKLNIRGKNNIIFFELALSDKSGSAQFFVNEENPGASTLHKPITYYYQYKRTITINCITIGEWARQQQVDHIDFMWLDMEGHELAVLNAMPSYLLDTVRAIYMEVNSKYWWADIPLQHEVIRWMENHKFTPIIEEKYNLQSDILFVRKSS